MTIKTLAGIEQLLPGRPTPAQRVRVAVVKAADEQVVDCLVRAALTGLVTPVLIDDAASVAARVGDRLVAGSYEVVDVADPVEAAAKGVELVRTGAAGILMKGQLTSGEFLKPVVNSETGIRTSSLLSHVAVLQNRDLGRLVAVTDGGMVLRPTLEQYPAIIEHARQVMAALGLASPKVALLSMAETVMPKLESSVLQAQYAASVADGALVVEGPLSTDLALVPESAAEKGWTGRIQGDADIIVAPDIVAANAFSKSLYAFGNGLMAGLVLGASVPIILVSRSATADEKYSSLLLALALQGTK